MKVRENPELFFQEFHDYLLLHDGEKMLELYDKWEVYVPPVPKALEDLSLTDILTIQSYVLVCREIYFTAEEKADATKWLRENGYSRLIKDIKIPQ